MTSGVRIYVVVTVAALVSVAMVVGIRLAPTVGRAATVIRRPSAVAPAKQPIARGPHAGLRNIAPFATVTVSSAADSGGQSAGVADGVVDANEWVARGELQGAWIKLTWDRPAVVEQIDLYDRPSAIEKILGGTLIFDDGAMIPVPKLSPDGTPWHTRIPPKHVTWIMFRIDAAQGRTTGLAEIMVFGEIQ
jgi:hypothetical protein